MTQLEEQRSPCLYVEFSFSGTSAVSRPRKTPPRRDLSSTVGFPAGTPLGCDDTEMRPRPVSEPGSTLSPAIPTLRRLPFALQPFDETRYSFWPQLGPCSTATQTFATDLSPSRQRSC